MKRRLAILILFTGLQSALAHAAPPSPGMLADGCAGCHGTKGLGAPHMPMLAGLDRTYLSTVLKQYKTGLRPSTVMARIARAYTDDELERMANYFSVQPWISPDQDVDERKAKKGAAIHEKECEICHGDNGRFMDEKTPRLAGQGIEFLVSAMREYMDEERRVMKKYMRKIMEDMRDRHIEALAHFYANEK